MQKTVVLDVVGLTKDLLTSGHMPNLEKWVNINSESVTTIEPAFPAVTCVPQTTYLTGKPPSEHGIVANGFYDKDYCEVRNWHQSSKLVKTKRIFETIKEMSSKNNGQVPTTFSNCWWFPMYDESIDFVVTPRPQYLQNGGKVADIYTKPASLRDELQNKLGAFPLHRFWGQLTSIESSQWIADASIYVDKAYNPTLSLVYLPHLDYCLQKFGPNDKTTVPLHLREIDQTVISLINYYTKAHPNVKIMVLSEYGISPVDRVIHINKVLRNSGYVQVRKENGGETLDCGASDAFAVSDHQVAHVYVKNKEKDLESVRQLISEIPGVDLVLDAKQQSEYSLSSHNKERSGDLVAVADSRSWFSYYYWKDESQAPDFARCVAIHRKPGYDPAEMLFRFENSFLGKLYLFFKILLIYVLHFRANVDVCPLDGDRIRGSHGIVPKEDTYKPVLISRGLVEEKEKIRAEDVHDLILKALLNK